MCPSPPKHFLPPPQRRPSRSIQGTLVHPDGPKSSVAPTPGGRRPRPRVAREGRAVAADLGSTARSLLGRATGTGLEQGQGGLSPPSRLGTAFDSLFTRRVSPGPTWSPLGPEAISPPSVPCRHPVHDLVTRALVAPWHRGTPRPRRFRAWPDAACGASPGPWRGGTGERQREHFHRPAGFRPSQGFRQKCPSHKRIGVRPAPRVMGGDRHADEPTPDRCDGAARWTGRHVSTSLSSLPSRGVADPRRGVVL